MAEETTNQNEQDIPAAEENIPQKEVPLTYLGNSDPTNPMYHPQKPRIVVDANDKAKFEANNHHDLDPQDLYKEEDAPLARE